MRMVHPKEAGWLVKMCADQLEAKDDGRDLHDMDPEFQEHGEIIFSTQSLSSGVIEGWVQEVAKCSGQRVDWVWSMGFALIKAMGDLERVKAAITELMPLHDELYRRALVRKGMLLRGRFSPPRPDWWASAA